MSRETKGSEHGMAATRSIIGWVISGVSEATDPAYEAGVYTIVTDETPTKDIL